MKIFGNDGRVVFNKAKEKFEIIKQNANRIDVRLTDGRIYRCRIDSNNANDVFASDIQLIYGEEPGPVPPDPRWHAVDILGTDYWCVDFSEGGLDGYTAMAENLKNSNGGIYFTSDEVTAIEAALAAEYPEWRLFSTADQGKMMTITSGSGYPWYSKDGWDEDMAPGTDLYGLHLTPDGRYVDDTKTGVGRSWSMWGRFAPNYVGVFSGTPDTTPGISSGSPAADTSYVIRLIRDPQ